MMPVGANGESAPALAPLPTMIAIRKSGMPARAAVAIAIGASERRGGDVARSHRRERRAEHEEHDRDRRRGCRGRRATAWCASRSSVPLRLRQREQQRHAGQRQEQLARKAAHHGVDRHAADVDADDPGERDRQHADVQPADAADEDRERERADRDDGEVHAGSARANCSELGGVQRARAPVKSATWCRHETPLATSTVAGARLRAAGSSRRSPIARETSKCSRA